MHKGGRAWAEEINGELSALVTGSDWRLVCQQVLPLMGEAELLRLLRVLGERHFTARSGRDLRSWAGGGSSGSGADGVSESSDAALVLAGVEWRDIRDVLLANALASAGGALRRVLATDAAARREIAAVEALAAELHGTEGAERRHQVRLCWVECVEWIPFVARTSLHPSQPATCPPTPQAFLASLDLSSPRQRLLLIADAYTLGRHWLRRCGEVPPAAVVEELLTRLGWRWERRSGSGGTKGEDSWRDGRSRERSSPKASSREGDRRRSAPAAVGLVKEAAAEEPEGGALPPHGTPTTAAGSEQQQQPARELLSRGTAPSKRARSRSRSSSRSRSRGRSSKKKKRKKGKDRKGKRRRRESGFIITSDDDDDNGWLAGGRLSSDDSGGDEPGGSLSKQRQRGGGGGGGGGGGDAGAVYRAWPQGGGGPCIEGGAERVIAEAVRWACRQWVRALLQ